jgi:hypothetical protein
VLDLEKDECPFCGKVGGHEVVSESSDPNLPWYDLRCKCGCMFVFSK